MSDARDDPADLSCVFNEFLARRQRGESASLDDYCVRFPQLADQLRLHVDLYDALAEPGSQANYLGDVSLRDPLAPFRTQETTRTRDEIDHPHPSPEDEGTQRTLAEETFGERSQLGTLNQASTTADRYDRLRLHATGGIGRVWLAHDSGIGRNIALKELRPEHSKDATLAARFLQEARITGQLEHPAIIPVYEMVDFSGERQPFYTMRFVNGRTLTAAARSFNERRLAGEADPVELPTLLNAFVTVCNAVAYAHSRGVIHRDLKGQNVILGDFGEVVLLDWGLAKLVGAQGGEELNSAVVPHQTGRDSNHTLQGEMLGTPAYMSPEQASGRLDLIDFHTDVYGLGAILYEILTGAAPFSGGKVEEVLQKVREEAPKSPRQCWPNVPSELEALCLQSLAKRPEDRALTATSMGQQVQRWLGETAERKLADQQRAQFFALSLDLMTIVGLDGYYKELNPAWERTFGWTAEELKARPWVDFLHPDDIAPTMAAAERLFGGDSLTHLENRFRCKDGSYRWMHWTGQVIAGQQLIYCVGRDISDRKRVEEALQQRTLELARLQLRLDSGDDDPQKLGQI